ncbi:hypothetical protein QF028_004407 [Neobacillus sp. B4I6]|uniref:DUF1653 domain-containing protein n=1 Tax=Neobacillus sp. B4I6 TaxID=3373925 RepID=UPI003D1B22E2
MDWTDLKINGIYQNNKNKQLYKVINLATHSETLEPMVVYMALYPNFKVWIRPLDLFLEKFQVDTGIDD